MMSELEERPEFALSMWESLLTDLLRVFYLLLVAILLVSTYGNTDPWVAVVGIGAVLAVLLLFFSGYSGLVLMLMHVRRYTVAAVAYSICSSLFMYGFVLQSDLFMYAQLLVGFSQIAVLGVIIVIAVACAVAVIFGGKRFLDLAGGILWLAWLVNAFLVASSLVGLIEYENPLSLAKLVGSFAFPSIWILLLYTTYYPRLDIARF